MPSVRQIRRRIRSVQNTAKITKAMATIAASRMRRAQQMAISSRPYSNRMQILLADLAAQRQEEEEYVHPLLRRRETRNLEVVLITPDRGLTGGLNNNINRVAAQFILEQDADATVLAVGKKGRDFMIRHRQNVKAVFTDMGDRPTLADVTPISLIAMEDFAKEKVDAVYLVYAQFISTTVQRPAIVPLLPVTPAELRPQDTVGYIYEPQSIEVMSALLPRFVEMQIYHALLEGVASEQSARMVAMQHATDSAGEMIEDLTLAMNKARQEAITREILDIVGGASAVGV